MNLALDLIVDILFYIFEFRLPYWFLRRRGSPFVRLIGVPLIALWIPIWIVNLLVMLVVIGISLVAEVWEGSL